MDTSVWDQRVRTITVTSSAADVGKTMVATQLAYEIALTGTPTCLIDLDESGDATVATVRTVEDLAGRSIPTDIVPIDASWLLMREDVRVTPIPQTLLTLVPADEDAAALVRLEQDAEAHERYADRLRAFLGAHADRFDVVVIDTPATCDVRVQAALRASTHALTVASPDKAGLAAIGHFLGHERTGVDRVRGESNPELRIAGVVLNRSRLDDEGEAGFLVRVTQRRPEIWIRDDEGVVPPIPEDPLIAQARRDGRSVATAGMEDPSSTALIERMRRLFLPIMGDLIL